MQTIYDRLLYPTDPQAFAYPASFGAMAKLYGAEAPSVRGYRALEIGCGDGVHLMAMALDAPESEFFGFDLAPTAIAAAQRLAQRANIRNVRFERRDILDHGLKAGSFDYVVAHGVYAWTPPIVQAATLRLIAHVLSERGLAVVSFNVMPGCGLRQILRETMLRRAGAIDEPAARIDMARGALCAIAADPAADSALAAEARVLLDKDPAILFHDDLGEVWRPCSIVDFSAAAADVGLDVLCDCDPSYVTDLPAVDPSQDWLDAERARDGRELTRFRRAILRRADRVAPRAFSADSLRGLWACAELSIERTAGGVALRTPDGGRIATDDPRQSDFLIALAQSFPRGLPLDHLADHPDMRIDTLLRLVAAGAATLRTREQRFAASAPTRPRASALARAQLADGRKRIASLRCGAVEIADAAMRDFLQLLDGNKTVEDLTQRMAKRLNAPREAAAAGVASALADAARMGLLTA